MHWIKNIITCVEEQKAPLGNFIAGFLFIVLCRNFFEIYATGQDDHLLQILTYSPFYPALACWMILLLHLLTGEQIPRVSRVVLLFFFLILLPPIIDLLLNKGAPVRMRYIAISGLQDIIEKFFTWRDPGISTGQRIEIAIATLCSFFYFKVKTGNWMRSVFSALMVYSSIFVFGILMYLLNGVFLMFKVTYVTDNSFILARFYFIITLFCVLALLYRQHRNIFIALLKDIRPLRMLHFIILLILGFVLYLKDAAVQEKAAFILSNENFFYFPLVIISGIFGGIFSIITNNIEDVEIDRISNPGRPFVHGVVNRKFYMQIAIASLLISLLAACLAGRACFIFMTLIIGVYYIYSCPPFRLKRFPFLSKFLVGLASLFVTMLGFTLFGGPVLLFPLLWIIFLLVPFALASNFIDIKDKAGDEAAGIRTLPVLLGMRNARLLIAFFTLCSYISVYFILQARVTYSWLFIPFIIYTVIHLYFLLKNNYRELPVMLTYLSGMISAVGLLWWS
ncbi:MAG: UbiA family prenyltransferase [Flavobacteriales bacterium]